jgi:hypothetical protein
MKFPSSLQENVSQVLQSGHDATSLCLLPPTLSVDAVSEDFPVSLNLHHITILKVKLLTT